jgi:hypothetical protein
VTGPVTYRELIDDAASALTGLHTLVNVPYRDPADAAETIGAWRWFVATCVRHAALLAPNDDRVRSLPQLCPDRGTVRAGIAETRHPAWQALMGSCALLGLAHDLLASHFGPERQHRTPDAARIEGSGPTSPALRTVSSLLLTAAVAHQALARRAMDLHPASTQVPAPVVRLLREGVAILGPAARIHDRARAAGGGAGDALGDLTPATVLTEPAPRAQPVDQLAEALSRLRVAAYRQGRGELVAGAATMRAVTAVAAALVRGQLDRARSTRRPPAEVAAVAAAGRCWVALHDAWNEVATLSPGSRGVLHDAVTALRFLAADAAPVVRHGTDEGSGDDVDWLCTTAASLAAAMRRLGRDGQVLVPTRWCEDVDIPRAWTPAWPEHLDRLGCLHRATERAGDRLRCRASWSAGSTAAAHPAVEVLARTS